MLSHDYSLEAIVTIEHDVQDAAAVKNPGVVNLREIAKQRLRQFAERSSEEVEMDIEEAPREGCQLSCAPGLRIRIRDYSLKPDDETEPVQQRKSDQRVDLRSVSTGKRRPSVHGRPWEGSGRPLTFHLGFASDRARIPDVEPVDGRRRHHEAHHRNDPCRKP